MNNYKSKNYIFSVILYLTFFFMTKFFAKKRQYKLITLNHILSILAVPQLQYHFLPVYPTCPSILYLRFLLPFFSCHQYHETLMNIN